MHPVIQRLLARRGARVPVNDGRKIVLALFGGSMSAVRGAGAVTALEELGLTAAFDAVYSFSAGVGNASYFLAGQAPLAASIYYNELIGRQFINLLRPWRLVDTDYLIHVIRDLKPLDVNRILESPSKSYFMVTNLSQRKFEFIDIQAFGLDHFFDFAKAAMTIPILSGRSVKIRENNYRDVLGYQREYLSAITATDATDVLVIYNQPKQKSLNKLSKNIFEIIPETQGPGFYDTRKVPLKAAAAEMGKLVKNIFGVQKGILLP